MASNSRRHMAQTEYVTGSTARQIEKPAHPVRYQEKRHTVTVRRNQAKALPMDIPYVIMLTIAAICTLYLCFNYLQLQATVAARMDHIESLVEDIEKLKADNDALETRINTSVDLDHVYQVATEELGMVYANKSQVRLYNRSESGYIRQYEDIPER